eukprot:281034-Chlamydomonas_euryale.AAC.1
MSADGQVGEACWRPARWGSSQRCRLANYPNFRKKIRSIRMATTMCVLCWVEKVHLMLGFTSEQLAGTHRGLCVTGWMMGIVCHWMDDGVCVPLDG